MKELLCVPEDTITGKDLDYLSDMFEWNYTAFKKCCNDMEYINDKEINEFFGKTCDFFEENLNMILDILGGEDDE